MLTYDNFKKCINAICFINGVEIDEHRNKAFYELIKNDFDNVLFGEICRDICKNENLFGKYPTPNMFYFRKKESEKTIFIEEGSFYLDNTIPAYKTVLACLTDEEADNVCENLWRWLMKNKRGELVSEQFIIDRLKQFMPIQNQESQIEDGKVKNLLLTAVKKIGG